MNKQTIDINTALFETLKNDYNHHKQNNAYQSQLQSGFDYLEALIKIFASINISVVKDIDDKVYKDIFTKNFKLAPSLGDFKSLATVVFSKSNHKKLINNNELYDLLYTIFNTKISLELVDSSSILDDNKKVKNFNSTIKLLNEYVVSFRNKIKGHGASFRDNDLSLRDTILENLDKVLTQLNITFEDIISNLTFESINSNITIKYKDISCELLPIVSYIECDKYSCHKNHKSKLFFYNDGKESKSHYIDYSFNHYFQITQQNMIHQNLKELQEEVLHSTSDTFRQSLLLSNFVGREQELNNTKKHILNSIKNNQSSFVYIVGKPGIGKSAFLTQLQNNIIEDETITNNINTYTFYAYKNHMGVEEDNYLYKKITSYFDTLGITAKQDEQFDMTIYLEKLFNIYEEDKNTKPLLLIIDGLDEFANPADIIKKFPLNFSSNIHIIFSSRAYPNILSTISSKLANKTEQLNILNQQNLIKDGYSLELGKLALNEVEELLSSVITKEINRESQEYKNIVNTIATQSEGLPLYIYYITQELKEKNTKDDEDITQSIISWAKKLPPKLENFYQDIFKSISPLARKILLILYFSKTGISKRELYQILKNISSNDFITLDKTAFEVEVFNNIEVFLKLNSDDTYSFYHLSVKEAIQEYLKEQDELAILDIDELREDNILFEEMIKQNHEYIQDMVYLDKQSDSYEFLQKLINYLKENNSSKYYKDNFFHLFNSLIWFDIFHHQISFEDMQDKNYKSISTTTKISQQNSEAIDELFKLFDTKENKHLFEIRYAYELAFIKEDYTKVLEYKDLYENYIHELFLDICLNIDKDEYIQKFIENKDEWENGLNQYFRNYFKKLIANNKNEFSSKFLEVVYNYKEFSNFIYSNTNKFSYDIIKEILANNSYKNKDVILVNASYKFIDHTEYFISQISDNEKQQRALSHYAVNIYSKNKEKALSIYKKEKNYLILAGFIKFFDDTDSKIFFTLISYLEDNYQKELCIKEYLKKCFKDDDLLNKLFSQLHNEKIIVLCKLQLYLFKNSKKEILQVIEEYSHYKIDIILEISRSNIKLAIEILEEIGFVYGLSEESDLYSKLAVGIAIDDLDKSFELIDKIYYETVKFETFYKIIENINFNKKSIQKILSKLKYLNRKIDALTHININKTNTYEVFKLIHNEIKEYERNNIFLNIIPILSYTYPNKILSLISKIDIVYDTRGKDKRISIFIDSLLHIIIKKNIKDNITVVNTLLDYIDKYDITKVIFNNICHDVALFLTKKDFKIAQKIALRIYDTNLASQTLYVIRKLYKKDTKENTYPDSSILFKSDTILRNKIHYSNLCINKTLHEIIYLDYNLLLNYYNFKENKILTISKQMPFRYKILQYLGNKLIILSSYLKKDTSINKDIFKINSFRNLDLYNDI